ncbi:MAG: hypothetical protein V4551_11015 [Pseudomonadota bacterium]
MLAQTALKADIQEKEAVRSEADRLELLRVAVQEIVDAKRNGEISEEEALSRLALLRRRHNGILGSFFSRRN